MKSRLHEQSNNYVDRMTFNEVFTHAEWDSSDISRSNHKRHYSDSLHSHDRKVLPPREQNEKRDQPVTRRFSPSLSTHITAIHVFVNTSTYFKAGYLCNLIQEHAL
jgi:hypothetical protein